MRTLVKFIATGVLALLGGCVFSLHPFYTDRDLAYSPALIGAWVTADATETWEFTGPREQGYTLVITGSDGKKGEFVVRLFRLEGHMFLDLLPAIVDMPQVDYYRDHLLPVHSAVRVYGIEPELKLAMMDPGWFEDYIAANPAAVRHEHGVGWLLKKAGSVPQQRTILTATTRELQAFLLAHLETKGAYFETAILKRRKT
jgi:hypothetical protein